MIAVATFFMTAPFILAFLGGMWSAQTKQAAAKSLAERRILTGVLLSVTIGALVLYYALVQLLWARLP